MKTVAILIREEGNREKILEIINKVTKDIIGRDYIIKFTNEELNQLASKINKEVQYE